MIKSLGILLGGVFIGAVGVEGEYDVVVDAAGTADSLERCVSLCRPGATLLLLATYWNGLRQMNC